MNKRKLIEALKLITAILVAVSALTYTIFFLEVPLQTKENTFDWNAYEEAIEMENYARIKECFTGNFYITGEVVQFLNLDSIVIMRKGNNESNSDHIIMYIPTKDVAKFDKGDVITVYTKLNMSHNNEAVVGRKGKLIKIEGEY